VKIRPALPDDRPFVLATAQRLAAFGPPPWRTASEIVEREARTLAAFFAAPPAGSALLVAESEQGERLGFAYLEQLEDYFTHEAHGHVGMLAVSETAEGKGIAGALMRAAELWALEQGYLKLTLGVFEGNRGARAMYEHLGYVAEMLRYVKIL
jgi:GNAT superfamily N-acetyltransferase